MIIRQLRTELGASNLQLLPEYRARVLVLQRRQYVDQQGQVLLKGQVASLIGAAHELVVTELLLQNVLGELSAAEVAALLSTLVFQDHRLQTEVLRSYMEHVQQTLPAVYSAYSELQTILADLLALQRELSIEDSVAGAKSLEEQVNPGLMLAVYHWANGTVSYYTTSIALCLYDSS